MSTHVPDASILPVRWTTSSYSGGGNNCVQAARLSVGPVAIRDSKAPAGPALLIRPDAWTAFITGVRSGQYNAR